MAEGEELGSNLLHVPRSNPEAQGGSPRSPEYGQIPRGRPGIRLRLLGPYKPNSQVGPVDGAARSPPR
jgi:hypothetical protein